jgi:hypothetical protein
MFEPQDHPDDIPYPGGPPTIVITPLTLVRWGPVDRVLEGFDGPFEKAGPPAEAGTRQGDDDGDGRLYIQPCRERPATAINRLIAAGEDVS